MIQEFDIRNIFPKFILRDKNGYAIARAITAALVYFLERSQDGLNTLQNVDKMPEWRLDELAWEYNCLYDYKAAVSIKREWIRDAFKNYRIHGTAEGVRQYLRVYFGESSVDEFWVFGGEPGEFNVSVTGERTDEAEEWIRKAVAKAKNVRSSLNNIIYNGGECESDIDCGTASAGMEITIESVLL